MYIFRWMDNLQFYILFNSISVLSGPRKFDNERLCAMFITEKIPTIADFKSEIARSVGQLLTY